MYAHRLLFTNANHDEDKDRDAEQDLWSSTTPRYSTNGLQMPGSDVALGNSKRKKKKKTSSLFSGSLLSRDGTENKCTGRAQDCDMNCVKHC